MAFVAKTIRLVDGLAHSFDRVNDSTNQSLYNQVTKSQLFRHTFGWISCWVRLPFHAVTIVALSGKIIGKVLIEPALRNTGHKYGPFSEDGIERDLYMLKDTVVHANQAAGGIVTAPSRHYTSLPRAVSGDIGRIFGTYHKNVGEYLPSDAFKHTRELLLKIPSEIHLETAPDSTTRLKYNMVHTYRSC